MLQHGAHISILSSLCIIRLLTRPTLHVGLNNRWGAAFTIVSNTLYIHGGKTDPSNAYSYTSAPTTNDLFALDLSTSFALDAPPWRLLSGVDLPNSPQGPALAWHTLTAYSEDAILGEFSLQH